MTEGLKTRIAAASTILLAATACGGSAVPQDPGNDAGAAERQVDTVPDRVVAEVNGEPITARQLEQVHEASLLTLGGVGLPAGEDQEMEQQARDLQLLINAELLIQAAREHGVEIAEQEIEKQLQVCRSQFASDDEFLDHLRSAGLDEATLRREAKRRLLMQAYASSITNDLVIDDSRAREIYEDRGNPAPATEEVRAAQIIVRVLPADGPDKRRAARRKIEQAEGRLREGEKFAVVAEEYSESPFASRGGDLGFFPRGRTLPEFEEVVFETGIGETTPIFETPHGYNIVKILDRREGSALSFEEIKTGLLMVLGRDQKNEALRSHVEELRRGATIRILDPVLAPAE